MLSVDLSQALMFGSIVRGGLIWFLAWLFARAVLHKLTAPAYFREIIQRDIPGAGGIVTVWTLVLLEAACAVSLLVPQGWYAGLVLAVVLLLGYAAVMARQILQGRAGMPCGCGGPDSELGVSWALVIRNVICALAALLAMWWPGVAVSGWAYAGAGLFALILAAAYIASDWAIRNRQWMEGDA